MEAIHKRALPEALSSGRAHLATEGDSNTPIYYPARSKLRTGERPLPASFKRDPQIDRAEEVRAGTELIYDVTSQAGDAQDSRTVANGWPSVMKRERLAPGPAGLGSTAPSPLRWSWARFHGGPLTRPLRLLGATVWLIGVSAHLGTPDCNVLIWSPDGSPRQ